MSKLKEKSNIFVDIDVLLALNTEKIDDYYSNLKADQEARQFARDLDEWNRGAFDGFEEAYWNID